MLPVSVSDILKILDKIPLWKSLAGLPKRVADLESRLKTLEEGRGAASGPGADQCPTCRAVMTCVAETDDPIFGRFGVKKHVFRCDGCGAERTRRWDPTSGYR